MKVSFANTKTDFDQLLLTQRDRLASLPEPVFESYSEDIGKLTQVLEAFQGYKSILLVGNGGSIWSFMAYWTALGNRVEGKTVVPLTDMEPDYLTIIKQQYQRADTLVVVVSKSGSTVGVIENIFAFWEYPQLYVTDPSGPIGKIGEARQATVIPHSEVGGRYSSFTASAYVPAILTDLPVSQIEQGGRAGYEQYRRIESNNPALQVALSLYELEGRGFTELFLPIYSNFLQTFGLAVTQLLHESFGKAGKGLTVLAAQAPESQHHTNQRFLGGRKNMIGCFLHIEKQQHDLTITVPANLQDLPLRDGKMANIDGISLADSFQSEYLGTFTDAKNQGIPIIDLEISEVNGQTVGELMAFWHYVTVFSALLRNVNPYDQPQVESSKAISFKERLKTNQS